VLALLGAALAGGVDLAALAAAGAANHCAPVVLRNTQNSTIQSRFQ
jgi:hypothetical protein